MRTYNIYHVSFSSFLSYCRVNYIFRGRKVEEKLVYKKIQLFPNKKTENQTRSLSKYAASVAQS